MIRQLSGQAIASNADQGILIIAERDGERDGHANRWIASVPPPQRYPMDAELDIAHQMTEMTRKGVINDVEL